MINKTLIQARLSMITDFCQELEQMKKLPQEEFMAKRNTAAAESFLRRCLEAVFDIGRHILAKSGHLDLAGEYKTIAVGLSRQHIVSDQLSQALYEMAGYRNRLVHLYHLVTDQELYAIIQNNLSDLQDFTRQIYAFLHQE